VPAPAVGPGIYLKLENEQQTGSFKVRGALARIARLVQARDDRPIYAASAGNHGLGVAYAARLFGRIATVFVPKDSPIVKREGIAAMGGRVVLSGSAGYDDTEREAKAAAEDKGALFVSPYDDPDVAAGNGGTVGLEILHALPNVDLVVAPVGGGGLMAGLAAARAMEEREVRLVGVQSEACPAMHRSLEEGRAIEAMGAPETLAGGPEGGVSPTSFALVRDAVQRIDLVSEDAIAEAIRFAYGRLGLTVEGSAATVLAWAREQAARTSGDRTTVLVVTGRNIDPELRRRILTGQEKR